MPQASSILSSGSRRRGLRAADSFGGSCPNRAVMIAALSQKSIGSQNPDFRQFYESAELTSALSALRNARTPVCSLSLLGQLFCLMSIEQP